MTRVWLLGLLMVPVLLLAACHTPPAPTATRGSDAKVTGGKDAVAPSPITASATIKGSGTGTEAQVDKSDGSHKENGADKGDGTTNHDAVDVRQVRRALSAEEAASYVGDATCASCHRAAAALQARSHHAHTLRAVSLSQDGANFAHAQSLTDPTLGYTYTPSVAQGKCLLQGRNARGQSALPADFVLGSGHNAFTYLSRNDSNGWVELRLSYYPKAHQWDYTPTQLPGTKLTRAAGQVQTRAMLTSCLLCHTTVLRATPSSPSTNPGAAPPDDPLPDLVASSLGVGCERCHGPGRTHVRLVTQRGGNTQQVGTLPVAATGRGVSEMAAGHNTYGMEDLHRASPDRINTLCGYCHRTPENAPANAPHTEESLPRFQGVALARSQCYQQSGTLSCLTCHDAHSNANPSLSRNDAICLRCHSATSMAHTATPSQAAPSAEQATTRTREGKGYKPMPANTVAVQSAAEQASGQTASEQTASGQPVAGKVCPVNARTGCTTCHMPKQSIHDIPHARYTNHWIKVWREASSSRLSSSEAKTR